MELWRRGAGKFIKSFPLLESTSRINPEKLKRYLPDENVDVLIADGNWSAIYRKVKNTESRGRNPIPFVYGKARALNTWKSKVYRLINYK